MLIKKKPCKKSPLPLTSVICRKKLTVRTFFGSIDFVHVFPSYSTRKAATDENSLPPLLLSPLLVSSGRVSRGDPLTPARICRHRNQHRSTSRRRGNVADSGWRNRAEQRIAPLPVTEQLSIARVCTIDRMNIALPRRSSVLCNRLGDCRYYGTVRLASFFFVFLLGIIPSFLCVVGHILFLLRWVQ